MSDLSSGRSVRNQLADLHIFVVPEQLWLDKYRTAFNNIALESVSAGFVRVHPETNLHQLRESIEEQLGEDIIPEEFIFLRSVGRCMAVVKENQEHLLRAADFLPPIAYSPEIFLLPGLHEHYAKPGTDSKNVVIATQGHTTAGMSTTHPFQLPMIPPQYATNQHLTAQPSYPTQKRYHGNQEENKRYEDDYQRTQKNDQTRYDDDDDNDDDDGDQNIVDNQDQENKTKYQRESFDEEQVHGQFESQGGRHSDGYHGDSEHRSSGENQDLGLSPRSQKKDHSSVKSKNKKNKQHRAEITIQKENFQPAEATTFQIIQPEVVHSIPFQGPDGVLMAPPTPIPSGRVVASPLPGPRKEKSKAKQDENTSKDSTGKESKTSRGNKKKRKERSKSPQSERDSDKNIKNKDEKRNDQEELTKEYVVPNFEDIEERSRYTQFPSPTKGARSHHPLYESEIDSGIADDLITPPQALNDSFGTKKNNKEFHDILVNGVNSSALDENEELAGQQAFNKGNEGDPHAKDSKTMRGDGKGEQNIAKLSDKDGAGKDGVGKDGKTSHKKTKKTVKKTVKKTDDFDEKLKNLKAVEPPPLQIPDHGDMSLEKDTPSAKDRKHKIVEELRGELRKTKNERVDLEKQRDQKVRKAKSLQTQTLQKRNQAKSIWKKKFFDEKRKTAPLEEQLNRLRYDVEVQHKAIVSYLETNRERDGVRGTQDQEKTPSEKTNQLMLLAKMQNEVEELKHKVEETKMRLASEMKLRDNAQSELKQLREDLLDKKINLTLTKSQKSLLLLSNQENITAQ
ncbi:myb-like protein V [Actinia tenebrosa]|uniref:Myb-like protein V n=1 Tax=Actinia tenebrosa TaxID=6105 RepID=A0A6P8IM62_ACTTE|nr:myb-like protein V [Actinia tenebrosa]